MPEEIQPSATPDDKTAAVSHNGEQKEKKKKDKVRSAWISFVGRIVAQVLGAIATVVLGLFVLQRYGAQGGSENAARTEAPSASERRIAARPLRPVGEISLAVLPLQNLSGDPRQEYFADGVTEALIADLARIEGLHVISRTSSMYYKGQKKALPEIAQELGVKWIVEGSVVKSGARVRVTAQLIDADLDRNVWVQNYDRALGDVLSLQSDVAAAIAKEVQAALTPRVQERFARQPSVDPAVYDLYLKGRDAWAQRTPQGFDQAVRYFDQAVEKDSTFALAHAGLADTYSLYGAYVDVQAPPAVLREAQIKARASADRALALDDGLARAHTSLAWIERSEWNWAAAEREFRRALELNPHYITAHQWYAIFLGEQGRDAEAVRHAEEAVSIDPLSGLMHQTLGLVHYYGRRYDRAEAAERRALELTPNAPLARGFLARTLLAQNRPREAIAVCEKSASAGNIEILTTLGVAYLHAGDKARAEAIRRQLTDRESLPTGALAKWYAAAGDPSAAFQMLDRSLAERVDVPSFKVDPFWDPLRKDPRFTALLRRMDLT
jgi:TolB-like protein/Tfp pilus assembly protein PilF